MGWFKDIADMIFGTHKLDMPINYDSIIMWADDNGVPHDIFPRNSSFLENVKDVNLSGLGLINIHKDLLSLPKLKDLNLSNNKIRCVELEEVKLDRLNLSNNKIKRLKMSIDVKLLDLKNNSITTFKHLNIIRCDSLNVKMNPINSLRFLKADNLDVLFIDDINDKLFKKKYIKVRITNA